MREFGVIHCRYWTWVGEHGLDDFATALGAYLLSCEHGNSAGLFRIPISYVAEDIERPLETVTKGFDNLNETGFLRYCKASKFVLLPKYLSWNQIQNPNQALGTLKLFTNGPPSSFTLFSEVRNILEKHENQFKGETKKKNVKVEFQKALETISKRLEKSQFAVTEPFGNKETETETETDFSTKSQSTPSASENPNADEPPSGAPDGDFPFINVDKKQNRHFSNLVGIHFKAIHEACKKISNFPINGKPFNAYQFVQKHANEKRHPGAIAETITAMADFKIYQGIKGNPFGYANSILTTKNQNYNEREAIKIHDFLKGMPANDRTGLTFGMLKDF